MNPKLLLIFPFLIIFIVLNSISYNYNSKFHFRLNDYFIDTTNGKEMLFMFVEVNKYDSLSIWENSNLILDEHDFVKDFQKQILIAHYYQKSDSTILPENIKSGLKKRFPLKLNIEEKFDYYPNGYIFTGTNTPNKLRLKNKVLESKSLIKAPITKPKPEYKARNILKN